MVDAMAGAAAILGFAAGAAEIRRRLMSRARVSRRLTSVHEPKIGHFRFQAPALMPGMGEDADPA